MFNWYQTTLVHVKKLERTVSHEDNHCNQYDQVVLLWNMYKICYNKPNVLTFVLPLNWAAIIGCMLVSGRPFNSNDVILFNPVTA